MPKKTLIDKMEEAGGISAPDAPKMPYGAGEYIKSGETARSWTGEQPWKKLRDRSTRGSPPFSDAELKQGYRKVGKE